MPALAYRNFDLLLERNSTGYRARVLESPVGQDNGEFTLPAELCQATDQLRLVGGAIRAFYLKQVNGVAPTTPLDPKSFGTMLFDRLFAGAVGQLYRRSLDAVQKEGKGLRVRLRLNDVPELAALPWEYLYDSLANRYLVLAETTPLVRYLALPLPATELSVGRPLRILGVTANAPDVLPPLDVEGERHRLTAALAGLVADGVIEINWLTNATLSQIQRALRRNHYHILHFIGHGWADLAHEQSGLVLVDELGRGDPVEVDRLAILLQNHATLRLAFLNACEGARQVEGEPFAGVAQHLVRQGLPAVIAMQFPVSDRAAIALAQEFYRALADGYGVDGALAEARKAIYGQKSVMEWGTPVLFLRANDGRLWAADEAVEEETMAKQGSHNLSVHTGGGTYISGNVNTGGGDFVGRQQVIQGDEVKGDKVAGDKVLGDKVAGHKAGGDVIVATVGAGARNVAIGKEIRQTIQEGAGQTPEAERQQLQAALAALLQATSTLSDQRLALRAEVHGETLQQELLKNGDAVNRGAVTNALDWLQKNAPALAPVINALLALPAVQQQLDHPEQPDGNWLRKWFSATLG